MDFKNKVIALVGPTGVGKTETSLYLAELTKSEIISCDSMQIYKGMDIGTAKATKLEMEKVPHHLINIKNPDEAYSVCEYVKDAKKCLEDIFSRGKNALVVGGTGLYVDSFIKDTNYTETSGNEEIRNELSLYAKISFAICNLFESMNLIYSSSLNFDILDSSILKIFCTNLYISDKTR